MRRYLTHYWLNRTWQENLETGEDGKLLDHIAGNLFKQHKILQGDAFYVVTIFAGTLFLCGKLLVGKVCGQQEAGMELGRDPNRLWDANEHIVAEAATPMRFDLAVPLDVTKRLRFISSEGLKPLKFTSPTRLDHQTLRGVRELDEKSSAVLDGLLNPLQPTQFGKRLAKTKAAKDLAYSPQRKYCRICWNTRNWRSPSGEARHQEHVSYVTEKGFGHEEWLFNFNWLLEGYGLNDSYRYKYGFMQPINKHLKKCQGQTFSILLYTRSPEGEHLIVARIDNLYVPEDDELDWALKQMIKMGWLKTMQKEVQSLGGKIDLSPFMNPKPHDIIDVRFRPQDVIFYDPFLVIAGKHKISKMPRYQLLKWEDEFPPVTSFVPIIAPPPHPEEEDDPTRSESQRTRSRIEGTSYDPRHIQLQNKLYWKLRAQYGAKAVHYEKDFVDLTIEINGETTLIEVKMELSARRCIRAALGQLLEYAHYRDDVKANRLLVVGDRPPSEVDVLYLEKLRATYALPLYYAQWDWETEALGKEV